MARLCLELKNNDKEGVALMKTVKQFLAEKPYGVLAISPDDSVYNALTLMAEANVGSLLVMDGERLMGIFTERDYARKVILHGKSSKETKVREIMTDKVCYVTPEASLEECMALMTDKRVRHLPVLDGEGVVGVVSIGDVVKETISDQQFIIEQLERYITT
jgi:CBS domain-containing protein